MLRLSCERVKFTNNCFNLLKGVQKIAVESVSYFAQVPVTAQHYDSAVEGSYAATPTPARADFHRQHL